MGNQKKFLNSKEINEDLPSIIQRNYLHFELKGLTRDTRDLVSNLINGILERIGADPLSSFHLFSGLMEALLNAIKGNIRFTIFKNELYDRLQEVERSNEEIEELHDVILDTKTLRDSMRRYIVPDKIKTEVQKILSLEEKVRVKKQEISEFDKNLLMKIRNQIVKDNRKISMKIRISEETLMITIKNDAPVMDSDMERINDSRTKHHELFLEGKSQDFFRPEFLDEKESAGFGIAMIDEGYYNMGLNPLELFTYLQGKHSTTVYLTYPLEKLRAGAFSF
ncbi:MAG: hypothetical protein H7A24_11470 [Leptospiraceae bacterium]|nr:hypothetical protein [Leptospiraceae bacterium]MCP5512493.1 hypothetical protein [Leptospiraceae bacterium]